MYSSPPAGNGTDLICSPDIDLELQVILGCCVRTLYASIDADNAATACAFTSTVMADALTRVGVPARVLACTLLGEGPRGRFGIGFPEVPGRPGTWPGHVCCMIDDVLIDPTVSSVRRSGMAAPLMVAVRAERPWVPNATLSLAPGATLTWRAEGAAQDYPTHRDLRSPLREPATKLAATALAHQLERLAMVPASRRA